MAGRSVHVLYHVHPETDRSEEDRKMIGIYTAERGAQHAIARDQSGFRDYPDGFTIDVCTLDQDHWIEGCIRRG